LPYKQVPIEAHNLVRFVDQCVAAKVIATCLCRQAGATMIPKDSRVGIEHFVSINTGSREHNNAE
jgi:hypothetical protein